MRGTVRWRNGAWRIQVYAGKVGGRERRIQRTVRAPNTRRGRAVAEAALAHLLADVDVGRVRLGDDPTVADVVERWMLHRAADWSPRTVRNRRGLVDRYIAPAIGGRRLAGLRGHDLADLYTSLRTTGGPSGRPLSPGTVAQVHKTLHAAFAEAVRWDLIAVNPADRVRAPAVPPPRPNPPSADRVGRALDQLDGPFAVFVRVAATTGGRRGQVCALRWADVDLAAGTVTFAAAVVDTGDGGLVVRPTKTGRAWRVAVDVGTVAVLAEHRRWCAARALSVGASLDADRFVFSDDPASRTPWRPGSVSHRWRRTRARIGLDGVPLKDLRHLVATELLVAGVDVRTVAGRLGHTSPTVTLSTYAAFVPASDRAAAEQMGRLLGGVGSRDEHPGDRTEGRAERRPQGPGVDVLH